MYLAKGTRDEGLDDRPSVFMKQVDFIDDQQLHELRKGHIGSLSRDDIPLFRCGYNHLGLSDLSIVQQVVIIVLISWNKGGRGDVTFL